MKELLKNISSERLRQVLFYDADTGVFRWRKTPSSVKALLGCQAGTSNGSTCYIRIKVDGTSYQAHRLAWLHYYGCWPVGDIDHVNGDRSDNRISNLRDVPHSVNTQNIRRPNRLNKSGFLGVTYLKNRWKAKLQVSGKPITVGMFDTPEEAHSAYLSAKRSLHIGCTI